MLMKKLLPLVIAFLAIPFLSIAQVTTSSVTGVVKDGGNFGLAAGVVTVTHLPTGTVYQTTTDKNGKYDLVNLIPGGP